MSQLFSHFFGDLWHRNVVTCDEHGVVHVEGADEGLGGEPGHQAAGRGQPPQSEDNGIHCTIVDLSRKFREIFTYLEKAYKNLRKF